MTIPRVPSEPMKICFRSYPELSLITFFIDEIISPLDKTASKPKESRKETDTDKGARFNFDFASDTFQKVLQNDFKDLAGLIMDNFKQTFESKRIFGFWSKEPAMEVGKSSKALMLEDSALGKPFDGINLTGNWNMELWGAISHYYAEAVSKNIGQSNIQYWGFVGDGATGDVDNIYAKVEKVVSPPQNPVAINIICGEFI